MTLRLTFKAATGQLDETRAAMKRAIAEPATAAVREGAEIAKQRGRAEIARAGFSKRWQNAWRAEAFPKRGKVSVEAAGFAFHRASYAGVFAEGATIRGRPRLWLPLPGVPQRIRRKRMTPDLFRREIGDLASVNRPGRDPLLVAPAALNRSQARKRRPKVSLAALRRGAAGFATGRTVMRRVPVFVGQRRVTVPKKFDLAGVIRDAGRALPDLFRKHFKG